MMIPRKEKQTHLAHIAQLLRPGLSPTFRSDAHGAAYYDQYRETVRTNGCGGAHPVPAAADLAVLHDPHTTLTVAISTPCDDSQASPSFGIVLARLAVQLGYNYFQTWETATLLQRRHMLHAGDTAASRRADIENSNDVGNGTPGACEDQIIRFWVSRIVPFLCLPVVRVDDFDDDSEDDDDIDVDDDSDDLHDDGNHHYRRFFRSNNNSRYNYSNNRRRHYYYHSNNSSSPGSGAAGTRDNDNDDFHRRLEHAAASLVHGALFTLRRHGHGPSNWTTSATVDTALFAHRPDSHVPYTRLMQACARVQQTFNALALQVVTDARLQEASGLCMTERKLFAQCVERAYRRLDDVLLAECVAGERTETRRCLWSKGLNGWVAVGQSKQQQNGNVASPGNGSSSSSSSNSSNSDGMNGIFDVLGIGNTPQNMSVRDVVDQCGPNTCLRRLTLQRDTEHWLVVVNEHDVIDDMTNIDDDDDDDDDDRCGRQRVGVALVASVKKDKVMKSGVVVLPDVKRFLDLTADVEVMVHAESGPVREMIAGDLKQAGVLCDGDVVADAGIVTRDEDEVDEVEDEEGNAVLDAWAFPTSGSRRGRK